MVFLPDLTQEQIDALFLESKELGSVDEGVATANIKMPTADKKYKPYDFRNPKIFPQEHMRIINLVHENYAKHLSSFLSGILRTECSIDSVEPEEIKYHEYRNALPPAVMLGILELAPIDGNVILDIRRETCYMIIDRLLGGTGESVVIPDDFSDIELKILGSFCEQLIAFFKDAWTNIIDVTPSFLRIETNSRLSQLMPLEESVIVVAMDIKILNHTSTISVCLPCLGLEDKLNATAIYLVNSKKRTDDPEETKSNIMTNLKTSNVDIRGILGTASLTLKDLLQLQVGDVVTLDKPVEKPVVLKIGTHDWFDGEIGTKKNKMAVKIRNILHSTF